jgi:hypothetical protein
MIENPFSVIDRRLNKIESLLVEIKGGDKNIKPPKSKTTRKEVDQKNYAVTKFEKGVGSNG